MRRSLLTLLFVGTAGTLAELLLLGHTDGYWQRLPLFLLSLGILVLTVEALRPGPQIRALVLGVMLLHIGCGAIGLYQHYSGNREFELEMNPSRHGFELLSETLTGATPALAPAALIYLGLLGIVYCRARDCGKRKPDACRASGDSTT